MICMVRLRLSVWAAFLHLAFNLRAVLLLSLRGHRVKVVPGHGEPARLLLSAGRFQKYQRCET